MMGALGGPAQGAQDALIKEYTVYHTGSLIWFKEYSLFEVYWDLWEVAPTFLFWPGRGQLLRLAKVTILSAADLGTSPSSEKHSKGRRIANIMVAHSYYSCSVI